MWPWGHLAVAYLAFSLVSRAYDGKPPTGGPTLVLAVASQIPDLVDKPLSWGFDVFAQGYGVGHSVFFAAPAIAVALAYAVHVGRTRYGLALGVGWSAHLASDVLFGVVLGEGPAVRTVLWPLHRNPGYSVERGFFDRFQYYLVRFAEEILEGEMTMYLVVYALLFTSVLAVWILDGYPVLRELRRWLSDATGA